MSQDANQLALDLEDCVPEQHRKTGAAPGGIIADVLALAADAKAKNWAAALQDTIKLLQDLAGQSSGNLKAFPGAINWDNVWNIVSKLLPLIIAGLSGT